MGDMGENDPSTGHVHNIIDPFLVYVEGNLILAFVNQIQRKQVLLLQNTPEKQISCFWGVFTELFFWNTQWFFKHSVTKSIGI